MTPLFFYLFLALFISFICSLVEAVLLTLPKSYLASIKNQFSWAKSFLFFKENIDKPLSAILTLNTIAHTIGARYRKYPNNTFYFYWWLIYGECI